VTELERRLLALGLELDFPVEPELAPAVMDRVRDRKPFPWRTVAIAVTVVVVALGAAFAVPQSRSALLRWFHLRGVTVERVETLPPAAERTQADGLGQPLTRRAAERVLGFRLALPPLPGGGPKTVYVLDDALATVAFRAYGHPILLSEYRSTGSAFLRKSVGDATAVESARVGGDEGLWLAGAPHTVTYRDRTGAFKQRAVLVRGNVLLWVHGQLTMRLEGHLTKGQALHLGRLVR
jgi:hypothetical protein